MKNKISAILGCIFALLIVSSGYISAAVIGYVLATNGNMKLLIICTAYLSIVMIFRFINIIKNSYNQYILYDLVDKLGEYFPILNIFSRF